MELKQEFKFISVEQTFQLKDRDELRSELVYWLFNKASFIQVLFITEAQNIPLNRRLNAFQIYSQSIGSRVSLRLGFPDE